MLKQLAQAAYLYGSMPHRIAANTIRARRGRAPVSILFYHRVADDHLNTWTISNDRFTEQVEWLEKHFDLVSLEEAQRRMRSKNHRAAVAITFDDGYADNCEHALPLLIKKRIPCTYFVSTKFVLEDKSFPHDVAAGEPLRPNTIEQLRMLSRAGIEIGGHTRNHTDLGRLCDIDQLYDEVVLAARDLAGEIDRLVRYFAFPFGMHANLNAAAFRLARENGFEAVCSAYGGYNFPGDDSFHLQRIHGDPEWFRLKNWLTVDPRKLRTKRFDYTPKGSADRLTASSAGCV